MSAAAPIWLDLDGAVNARDVGGLPTVDGRTTRPGVLLRADNLQGLTPRDVRRLLDDYRLRTVLDLRSTGEVHLEGPNALAGTDVVHHQLSLIPEWDGEPDRAEAERAVEEAVAPAHETAASEAAAPGTLVERAVPEVGRRRRVRDPSDVSEHYIGYVEHAGANIGRALHVLADPASGTTLVHCAAGKDRTGVVVALALSLVGVTREAVVADYVRSAERAERILARLRNTTTYGPSLADVPVEDITPRARSIEGLLDHVDRTYGGPHGLAMALGVGEEAVARLGVRLLGTSPVVD